MKRSSAGNARVRHARSHAPTILITRAPGVRGTIDLAALRRYLARAAANLACRRGGEWTITLVNDADMGQLHKRTMGIPTTTDVLTFDLRQGATRRDPLELDTVICLDQARREAAARGHPVWREVLLYAIHSLLHVCGYNDLEPEDAAAMHRREDQILGALGVGPVYARPEQDDGSPAAAPAIASAAASAPARRRRSAPRKRASR